MFTGMPIVFALLLSCVSALMAIGLADWNVIAQTFFTGLNTFPILACPLFILAGYIMECSGMSERLLKWVRCFTGKSRGGAGSVALVGCGLFASMTGSGPATVAAMGTILFPIMVQEGYPKGSAAGLLACGGALGPIIPPSIIMMIYGTTMGVSIPDMFIGSVIPGLILLTVLLVTNHFVSKKFNITIDETTYTFLDKLKATWSAAGTLALPVIILGSIYTGICTPTEAAGLACVYSFSIALFYREMTVKKMFEVLQISAKVSAKSLIILGSANLFGWVLAIAHIPSDITNFLVPLLKTPGIYMGVLMMILFFIGTIMEGIASVLIIAPIIVPTGIAMGIDPLHLGVIFCIAMVLGFVTPPFGVNLFMSCGITKVGFSEVVKGAFPYIITMMVTIIIISYFPKIIIWLPNLMTVH
jgi:C4-dicarboxylate transporter DctM subunit